MDSFHADEIDEAFLEFRRESCKSVALSSAIVREIVTILRRGRLYRFLLSAHNISCITLSHRTMQHTVPQVAAFVGEKEPSKVVDPVGQQICTFSWFLVYIPYLFRQSTILYSTRRYLLPGLLKRRSTRRCKVRTLLLRIEVRILNA